MLMTHSSAHRVSPYARGFTMIEMAITMAIFGFLLAAALPSIGTWLDNTRIRNVTESIQSGIQLARAEAVRRNQPVSFFLVSLDNPNNMDNSCDLSNTDGSWVISVTAPNGHCGEAPSTTTAPMIVTSRTVGDAGGSVTVNAFRSDGTTAATTITFNGFGRITNADAIGIINVTGSTSSTEYRNLRLQLSDTGMVRMCDPRITSTSDPRKC